MNCPFYNSPHPLCIEAAQHLILDIAQHPEWQEEVEKGKMFGVLVTDNDVLWAYSGQILGRSDWQGYVPAVFDYLEEGGYFKTHEAEIVSINHQIEELSASQELCSARQNLYTIEEQARQSVEEYRQYMSECKMKREKEREKGDADESKLIRESQFQKAELRRIKTSWKTKTEEARLHLQQLQDVISSLKNKRKLLSDHLQDWLFRNFVMLNGKGEKKSITDIFHDWAISTGSKSIIPPSGSGECCAPKLLQYAFLHHLQPLAIAEFTIANAFSDAEDAQPEWREACQSRCAPILNWMLQGVEVEENPLHCQEEREILDIIYEDEHIIAVDKPAGMLSVPGRTERRSALDILRTMRPKETDLMMVHRLDMQTSGILIAAKNLETYKDLQKLFASHAGVKKTYIAILEGVLSQPIGTEGRISLPLRSDYLNRPRQVVDHKEGKESITLYKIIGKKNGHSVLELHPVTGRTHQLRVHCAHSEGLGMPILGDDIYGHHADRLHLYATEISFLSYRLSLHHSQPAENIIQVGNDHEE